METKKGDAIVLNELNDLYSVHPGEILQEELKERHIKQKDFAAAIGMEAPHLSALIHGRRNITSAIAGRLQEALGIPASVWINLQNRYNLDKARQTEGKNSRIVAGYLSLRGARSIGTRKPEDCYAIHPQEGSSPAHGTRRPSGLAS